MSREIRRVPANWVHPLRSQVCFSDGTPRYRPLFDHFNEALALWQKENAEWDAGTHKSLIEDPTLKQKYPRFADWDNECPRQEDYMPDWPEEERTHFQLYETCTEGTPLSPVLESFDAVCQWAADNHASVFGSFCDATKEQWAEMLAPGGLAAVRVGNFIFL